MRRLCPNCGYDLSPPDPKDYCCLPDCKHKLIRTGTDKTLGCPVHSTAGTKHLR